MNIREGIRQTFDEIAANKIRSFLTMLGINFGVASLIAIAVIGLSVRESVNLELGKFGSTLLWVTPDYSAYAAGESRTLLDERDISYFRRRVHGIKAGSTITNIRSEISYKGGSQNIRIMGISPEYHELFPFNLSAGIFFMLEDFDEKNKVCILGTDIASSLFENANPIGKQISLLGGVFKVVGVSSKIEPGILNTGADDNTVYVPEEFVSKRIWSGSIVKYWVYFFKFDTMPHMEEAQAVMGNYLENRYGKIRDNPRFRVRKLDSFIATVNKVMDIVSTLISLIAGISLLVGGLGIMNIMLVTVTERTREIGLRMAVGARRRDILRQFIIEAVTLCLVGGGIGVLFGIAAAVGVCLVMEIPFTFSLLAVVAALLLSSIIGLVFGIYPARKASLLTPVEALRVENG